jgi:hypothetical protein
MKFEGGKKNKKYTKKKNPLKWLLLDLGSGHFYSTIYLSKTHTL